MVDRSPKITDSLRPQFVADYLSGMTCGEVAAKYGVKQSTAWEWLKKRGLTRSLSVSKQAHEIREDAFSEFAGDAAYWLGFLLTDGSIYAASDGAIVLGLQISARDRLHVESFQRFLGTTYPVKTFTPKKYAKSFNSGPATRIQFRCRSTMIADLTRAGMTPRKSKTVVAAKELSLSADFWRGAIDGDGTIGLRVGRWPDPTISLTTASRQFAEQFSDYCRRTCPECAATISDAHHAWGIRVGGRHAVAIIETLYGHGGVSLARKQSIADEILSRRRADPDWCRRRNGPEAIVNLKKPWSPERRDAMRKRMTGRILPPGHAANVSASWNVPGERERRRQAIISSLAQRRKSLLTTTSAT